MRRLMIATVSLLAVAALAVPAAGVAGASVQAKGAPVCAGKTKGAAIKAIKKTWDTLLNGGNTATIDQKAAVVQGTDDPAFKTLFVQTATQFSTLLKTTTAKVTKVACGGKKQATVSFDLVQIAGGAPLLPGQTGTAVLVGKAWKASTGTICDLFSLADSSLAANPACANASG